MISPILSNPYGKKKMTLVAKDIPVAYKEFFAKDVIAKKHTGTYWSHLYGLPSDCVNKWARTFLARGLIQDHGRPKLWAEEDLIAMDSVFPSPDSNVNDKDIDKFRDFAIDRAMTRHSITLKNKDEDFKIPSQRSFKRLDEKLNLRLAKEMVEKPREVKRQAKKLPKTSSVHKTKPKKRKVEDLYSDSEEDTRKNS